MWCPVSSEILEVEIYVVIVTSVTKCGAGVGCLKILHVLGFGHKLIVSLLDSVIYF